jgi:small GTP-binding protein
MGTDSFPYDVFLSHSRKDMATVLDLAGRLRKDGLRVWLDAWEILPGDNIPAKIEEGLESSRLLLLCMSGNAFGSDWAVLESQTFRFRDPLNKERRFIPLRLDNAEPVGSLAQFSYVDWRAATRGEQYARLLRACRPDEAKPYPAPPRRPADQHFQETIILGHTDWIRSVTLIPGGKLALTSSVDNTLRLWEVGTGRCLRVLKGHSSGTRCVASSPDGQRILSGAGSGNLQIWDLHSGRSLCFLKGHRDSVRSIAWSPDGQWVLSGSGDSTIRIWEASSGRCLHVLQGHTDSVWSVAWSPDGQYVLSGSGDSTIRIWEASSGRCLRILQGHLGNVFSVAWSPDGKRILSGSGDNTVRLWDAASGRLLGSLAGHSSGVLSVAWSPDGRSVLSSSGDNTLRLWSADPGSGRCLHVLQGHTDSVWSAVWSADGKSVLSISDDKTLRLWDAGTGRCVRAFEGHSNMILNVAWSPDGRSALSGSRDRTVRLWDASSGHCLRILEGHAGAVSSIAWSPDGRLALSGSEDRTLRLWEVAEGRCLHTLEGHDDIILSVAWSPDGRLALSSSGDFTLMLWDVGLGRRLRVLNGHADGVQCLAWSPDGRFALSGSSDLTLLLWEVGSGRFLRVFEGHTNSILSVAWSPDGHRALSGSSDHTLRVWDVDSGRCLRVLEGHTDDVTQVTWGPDGHLALSGSDDRTLRLWDLGSGQCLSTLRGHTDRIRNIAWRHDGGSPTSASVDGSLRLWNLRDVIDEMQQPASGRPPGREPSSTEALQYTNAKILLVGESGAGKTGLSMRLAHDTWKESDSTAGAWATQWKIPVAPTAGPPDVEREIWLWDFGGQADQRLVHQLYMDETALAVLVFDPQKDDVFETLGQWDRDLARAARRPFQRLLVAGRTDTGGLRVSRSKVEEFARERGYARYLETSAKTGDGCDTLRDEILECIRWEDIPWRSSPRLFKLLKEEIIRLKDQGRVLMRLNELRETLQLRFSGHHEHFTDEQLKAVVNLLAGPGVVWELRFGSWVLLQPERINAYAQALIRTLRADEHQLGCILEEKVLRGELAYTTSMPRLPEDEERIVLLAMHQTLVERGLCLRIHDPNERSPTLLVLPSYYGRERPDLTGHPVVFVSYRFNGFLDDIYATLVVRMHHTQPFERAELWRYAADFKTALGKRLGLKLTRRAEGAGELEVYFDPSVSIEDKVIFSRYVHEHLLQKAQDVERLRHYVCPHCGTPVGNRQVAMKRLTEGKQDILCVNCERRVPLWDELEERFASQEIQKRVRALQEQARIVLDNESRERTLVGDVISTVALAGQISRELPVSDHGISMEIELRSDAGTATGKKLYLHLRGTELGGFAIDVERHADYWMSQPFPVLLIIRDPEGEILWMEVRDWLKRATENGRNKLQELIFVGERFDVMSVRRWRDRVLGGAISADATPG